MSKIRLIGFDVNGTLFDDTALFIKAINGIFPRFGQPKLPEDILRQRFGQPWTKIYRDVGITEAMASEAELYKLYNEFYLTVPRPKPFPGVKKAMEWLLSRRVDLFIVSTQQNAITKALLKTYGLDDMFVHVVGSVGDKAAAIRQLYDITGVTANETAYMGDQEGDIRHAKSAWCVSIAFAAKNGLHGEERLRKAVPDYLIRKYADLKKLPIF